MSYPQLLSQTEFYLSSSAASNLPDDVGLEVAMAGRSNAGKSSALNVLCTKKALARTSKTPGRTQLINFFRVNEEACLVDLPGYGFAKAPLKQQQKWIKLLEHYYSTRKALSGTVLVMDIRRPLRDADYSMLEWCVYNKCDIHILLNKCDKLGKSQANQKLFAVRKELSEVAEIGVSVQLFSALTKVGIDEASEKICGWLDLHPKQAAE
ncbi:MAG: ribosome biogenesis GTP-binding protein YihA/YsxC [Gammaproteobacteria bacterium]|nr:ribosome biogenesis GTP-binding protein YihA/YsxC [Gammaproteobacteria bacterium]